MTDSTEEGHPALYLQLVSIMSHTFAGQKSLVMLSGKEMLQHYSHTEHLSLN